MPVFQPKDDIPEVVRGDTSPYPTVVIVTAANHSASKRFGKSSRLSKT